MEPAEKEVVAVATPIPLDPRSQALVARDNSELVRMIKIFMQGRAIPASLDTEQKLIFAWQAAASLKLPPAIAIQNMAIIHGTLAIWGQLPKALAEATGELEDFENYLIDEEYNKICHENKNLSAEPWAAIVKMKRKGRTKNEYFFSKEDAKRAGLDKKKGPWQDYTGVMLTRRTIGMAIKFEFPDAVMGIGIAEYDLGVAPDIKDITPDTSKAEAVNEAFRYKAGEE